MELGMLESARELFERLKMYDDVITCMIVVEKESAARSLILKQLRATIVKQRRAKLYCILGDLIQGERTKISEEEKLEYQEFVNDNALDYYMAAWEVSDRR
jgi:hypothetical protein